MTMPTLLPTLVFDLDGTLVDTAPDLVVATNHALADLSLPPVPDMALRASIGQGARHMIVEALRLAGIAVSSTEIDRLLERFLAHYEANIATTSRPFEGAVDVLRELRDKGHRLTICTNKREGLSRTLLDALDLSPLFDAIAGRDTFPVHKPDPAHLTGVVRQAGGDPSRAIMIGDTSVDIATARAAAVPVIACSFGYADVPLAALSPDQLIGHYRELPAAIIYASRGLA